MKKLIPAIIAALATVSAAPAFADADAVPCQVFGFGTYDSGETFDGSAFNDGAGIEMLDWAHAAPGIDFEATTSAGGSVTCFQNGTRSAQFIDIGSASVNGTPGYTYQIDVQDNQEAPSRGLELEASISYWPTRRDDGIAEFETPETVTIPDSLPVTIGDGRGWAVLLLDHTMCKYRGRGSTYEFRFCVNQAHSGNQPGDQLEIEYARLRILRANPWVPMTSVVVELRAPVPGPDPDYYSILVIDPEGNEAYDFDGFLTDGDIDIQLLQP